MIRAAKNRLNVITAEISISYALLGCGHRGCNLPDEQLTVAKTTSGNCGTHPVVCLLIRPESRAICRQGLGEPSLRTQGKRGFAEHPGMAHRCQDRNRCLVGP